MRPFDSVAVPQVTHRDVPPRAGGAARGGVVHHRSGEWWVQYPGRHSIARLLLLDSGMAMTGDDLAGYVLEKVRPGG